MIMEASTSSDKAQQALQDADAYVRENPIPALLCALGVGFALGLLVRSLERPSASDLLEDRLGRAGGYLGAFASQTKRAYHKSADAVRDAVDHAKDIDVEDYTDPVVNWFSRMWKKCCG